MHPFDGGLVGFRDGTNGNMVCRIYLSWSLTGSRPCLLLLLPGMRDRAEVPEPPRAGRALQVTVHVGVRRKTRELHLFPQPKGRIPCLSLSLSLSLS